MSDVISQMQQSVLGFWTKSFEGTWQRAQGYGAELEKMGAENQKRSALAVDEMARLTKESIAYGFELNAAWRKLMVDAWQSTGLLGPSKG